MHCHRLTTIPILYVLIVALSAGLWADAAVSAEDELRLGVFPRRNAKTTVQYFKPLAEYLSQHLGVKVKVETAKNFKEFWKGVSQKKYDIVHYNQRHYIESNNQYGYEVFAKNEEYGSTTIAGAFVVRKDSGINSLQDLKGKKILFGGGKKAMISYVVNTVMLRRAGLTPNEYIEAFAKNPPNATIATFHRYADAAGVGDVGLKIPILASKGVDVAQLKLIGVSEPLPHLPWAVKGELPASLKQKIQQLLVDLSQSQKGRNILQQAEITGLHKATDAEYDIHRKILREVEQPSF